MVALLLALILIRTHPIHTTVLELQWNTSSATLAGTLRIFEDDLRAGAADARLTPAEYVLKNVGVVGDGRTIPLTQCGDRRAADAVLVCLSASVKDVRGLRVRNEILLERYDDQVNIVRVEHGTMTTMLLTRTARERPID